MRRISFSDQCQRSEEPEVAQQLRVGEKQPGEGADGRDAADRQRVGQVADDLPRVVAVVGMAEDVYRVAQCDDHDEGSCPDGYGRDRVAHERHDRQRQQSAQRYGDQGQQHRQLVAEREGDEHHDDEDGDVQRQHHDEIMEKAVAAGIGMVSPQRIDEINILQATYEAMREAISKLEPAPDILLNDAVTIPEVTIPQVPIIKGDAKSISIGAASIIAKVTRDRLMVEYDQILPEYGFASNKGYGSAEHIAALKKYGPSPIHRRSFIHNFIEE